MSSSPRATIGIFDSGVGGLSILAALRRELPQCTFLYVYDQAFFPYGLKTEEEVNARVSTLCTEVLTRYPLDLVVIACNTASTVVLPTLRQQVSPPVVGVVPAIKPAALQSRSKVIGLLATPGTIERPYTQELIAAHAPDCTVIKLGSARLVEIAEAKFRGEPPLVSELQKILAPLSDTPQLDTIVLGCTHFPHLIPELTQAFPRPITMVEPSAGVVRRVTDLLKKTPPRLASKLDHDLLLVTSQLLPTSLMQNFGFSNQELL
jgi:glutamate racemase